MNFVLLFFSSAVLIIFSLRPARLVVRSRISLSLMFLLNFAFFAFIWGLNLSFNRDDVLLGISGYGIGAIFAASVFLLFKRRKHDPAKVTAADLEICSYFAEPEQNQLQDLRKTASIRRRLYNLWFINYLFQTVVLTGIFCLLCVLS